jgi:hypothetical protein
MLKLQMKLFWLSNDSRRKNTDKKTPRTPQHNQSESESFMADSQSVRMAWC